MLSTRSLAATAALAVATYAAPATADDQVTLICDFPMAQAPNGGDILSAYKGAVVICEGCQSNLVVNSVWHVTPMTYFASTDRIPGFVMSVEIDRTDGTAIWRMGHLVQGLAESRGQCKRFEKPIL